MKSVRRLGVVLCQTFLLLFPVGWAIVGFYSARLAALAVPALVLIGIVWGFLRPYRLPAPEGRQNHYSYLARYFACILLVLTTLCLLTTLIKVEPLGFVARVIAARYLVGGSRQLWQNLHWKP